MEKRFIITLTEEEHMNLKLYAIKNKMSMQELGCLALKAYINNSNSNNNNKKEFKLAPNERIGLIDGVEYVTSTGEDLAI